MNIIVAADENWGIGKDGGLLRRISADMKRFRALTTGNVIVIGRKTLESFPNGKPLPDRENIVLTNNLSYKKEGITLCHSLTELKALLPAYRDKEIFAAGGGSVYKQLLPLSKKAYVTKIHSCFTADTFFPNLDRESHWSIIEESEIFEEKGIKFSFITYANNAYCNN